MGCEYTFQSLIDIARDRDFLVLLPLILFRSINLGVNSVIWVKFWLVNQIQLDKKEDKIEDKNEYFKDIMHNSIDTHLLMTIGCILGSLITGSILDKFGYKICLKLILATTLSFFLFTIVINEN